MRTLLSTIIFLLTCCIHPDAAFSQATLTQSVQGTLTDAASGKPLAGVAVQLANHAARGAVTDSNGFFALDSIPVGRQSFLFSAMGYEPAAANAVAVISGKATEINMALKESLHQLSGVTIGAGRTLAKNAFATVSARSFSPDETRRYAAALADPARMAMNFPGVSNAGDFNNAIVVRGNSPQGMLWRLEGIEIPNPNHFSSLGGTGGAISMLNAQVLGQSDFLTGAFPAEYGNALSGVFDLSFRKGNTSRPEHSVQIGTLGAELGSEGPLRKGAKSSYLVNYRYATTSLLKGFLDLGGQVPDYQDASFKLHLPTAKAGTFSVFGLGGYNRTSLSAPRDSAAWNEEGSYGNTSFAYKGRTGIAGVSHQIFLGSNAYLRTVLSASYQGSTGGSDTLDPARDYQAVNTEQQHFGDVAYRLSALYNRKLNAGQTLRAGLVAQRMQYDLRYAFYDGARHAWRQALSGDGSTQFYQAYAQWKGRLTDGLTAQGGLHSSYLALNQSWSLEPRAALTYDWRRSQASLAAGLHSKPAHLSTYLYHDAAAPGTDYPNKSLDLQRAFHLVGGYSTALPLGFRLKAEVYYQHLYAVPVEADSASHFSTINAESAYDLLATSARLVSKGTGRNYGVDLSLERSFADGWYLLAAGSVFRSEYSTYGGQTYSTRYNRGYQVNAIAGRELKLNRAGRTVLGLNGKLLTSGGLRESPIDLEASKGAGSQVLLPGQYYTLQAKAYLRADASVYCKFNRRRATHTIQLDVQNLTNRQNPYGNWYDARSGSIRTAYQMGIFPNLSYRLDFHW